MSAPGIEFGLGTFGDVTVDDDDRVLSQAHVIRNIVEEGVLADQVGVQHSFESRDAWLKGGMELGVNEGYAKLEQMLADGTV